MPEINEIKKFKPYTPSRRKMSVLKSSEITQKKNKPEKKLIGFNKKKSGRNNQGKITVRHRGCGNKKKYRIIDFKRDKRDISAIVKKIEYDPNRTANIALLLYADGEKRYIISPFGLKIGDELMSGENAEIKIGNALPMAKIPVGSEIHNIEMKPGKGAQLARAAGNVVQLVAKEGKFVTIKLPSGEMRLILSDCYATIGQVGNINQALVNIGKAGRKRHMGIRPTVRGAVMNPNDHPHGGGEGKNPIGRPGPCTPWGKPALGYKTRKKNKSTEKYILRHRKKK